MNDKQNNVFANLILLIVCGFILLYLFQNIIDNINYRNVQNLVEKQQIEADINAIEQIQSQYPAGKLITSQALASFNLEHKKQINLQINNLPKPELMTPAIQDNILRNDLIELKKTKLEELSAPSSSEINIPPVKTLLFGVLSIFFTKIVSNLSDGFCNWIFPNLNKMIRGFYSLFRSIDK